MRMYLKNNKKRFIKKKIIVIIAFLIIFIYIYNTLFKNLNNYYLKYSSNEASKIITNSISHAVNSNLLNKLNSDKLYTIIKNKTGEVEMIEYNTYLVNIFLKELTDNIVKELSIYENKTNKVAFYVPMGSIFNNPVLVDKGPKIPVRMKFTGSVITGIHIKPQDYGINNSLIKLYVHVEIKEQLLLPTSYKDIKVTNDIPISYKIIKGKIPTYYSGNLSSYTMPLK